MGSPEKPLDVEMGDMSDETNRLNPNDDVEIKGTEKGDAEVRFTGLKKEELLEISSQKKWVVTRWVLFIFFWLAWIGMLVGAIIIVIKAPRCKDEPTPPWYQDTIVYQADVRKFAGDLAGMTNHVDYVKSLKSKTLTICHANDPDDLAEVVGNGNAEFSELLEMSHNDESDKDLKVVIDLRIDALSTSSSQFNDSATADCAGLSPTGKGCAMFFWKSNSSESDEENWALHPVRDEYYKVTGNGSALAYVNYADAAALTYIKDVVKAWIEKGADGFQLRDISVIADADRMGVVEAVQMAINESQSAVEEEKRKVIGLFLLASDTSVQSSLFPGGNETDAAAVVINTALATASSASEIKSAILDWRSKTEPFIASYAADTMDQTLLAERLGKAKAAGHVLFTYSLPGVPVIRSGDEGLLDSDVFTWNTTNPKLQTPNGGDLDYVEQVAEVSDLRLNKHTARRSLRWDNEDAVFAFLDTDDTEVVAFHRKWDIKPTILAVYNTAANDTIVKVSLPDAGDNKKFNKRVVLASSVPSYEDEEKSVSVVPLKGGQTILFELKAE